MRDKPRSKCCPPSLEYRDINRHRFFLGTKRALGRNAEKIRRDLINAAALARRRNGSLIGELFQTVCPLVALEVKATMQTLLEPT